MTDVVDKLTRSRMMAGIQGKNTKPEVVIRKALFSSGFRYRKHVARLPGKPDIVFRKYNAVVFIHGCFWHRHLDCYWCANVASNVDDFDFWKSKFEQNVERDKRNISAIRKAGWRVAIVWECTLKVQPLSETIDALAAWLTGQRSSLFLPTRTRMRLYTAEKPGKRSRSGPKV